MAVSSTGFHDVKLGALDAEVLASYIQTINDIIKYYHCTLKELSLAITDPLTDIYLGLY